MRRLLLALPASLLLAGCGLLYAEIEVPRASLTLLDEAFPLTSPGDVLTKDLDYDLGSNISILNDKNFTFEIRLDEMEIASETATQPAGVDLSTVDTVEIKVMAPAGSGLLDRAVVTYTKPAGAAGPIKTVTASAHGNVDLGPYLRSGKLTLRATATGTLPNHIWNADITGTFYLKAKYAYGKLI